MSREPRIRILPVEVANRIAAGEVVERPASVVKELVENSLDAGARRVRVSLEDGGRRRIRVVDDGHGMTPDEARLALQRHATSKIRGAEDLERIRSLGFRGEALPSIAAVSRLEIVTREPAAPFAWRLRVEGGRILAEGPTAAPAGTSVTAEDLFYNTPARRKHLRQPATELGRILDVLHGLALAHPEVAFQVDHGGRLLLQTPGDGDVGGVVAAAFGPAIWRQMLVARHEPAGSDAAYRRLEVYVGRPAAARASRQFQFFILNGRAVRSDALREALERPFRRLLPLHRYPVAVVRLEVDPAAVDVNVHPSKEQVRLAREAEVAEALRALVARVLAEADLAPRVHLGGTRLAPPAGTPAGAPGGTPSAPPPAHGDPDPTAAAGLAEAAAGLDPQPAAFAAAGLPPAAAAAGAAPAVAEHAGDYGRSRPRFTSLRVLGQIDRTYLVAEGPEGLYLIDQHAAHERVVFEQLLGRAAGGPVLRQALAVPLPVELDQQAMERWRRHRERLERYGFVSEAFGPRAVLLRQVPLLYRGAADSRVFLDLLDAMGDGDAGDAELEADLAQRTMASCKAAVKAHDPVSPAEAQRLLEALDGCRNPFTCPHGRPTLLVLTLRELERHFKRVL